MHSVLSQTHVVKLNVSCRLTHLYASTFMWSLCQFAYECFKYNYYAKFFTDSYFEEHIILTGLQTRLIVI